MLTKQTCLRTLGFLFWFAAIAAGQGFTASSLRGVQLVPDLRAQCIIDGHVLTVITVSGSKRLTCAAPPGLAGGEANTASNLPAGTGIFASKVGTDLRFKSLLSGNSAIVLTNDANTITFILTPSNITLQSLGGALNLTQISAPADDTLLVSNGSAVEAKALPNCNTATQKLHYDLATNTWSCQTDATGGGVGWQESTFASLPAAAGASGQTYVVTDAPSKSTCTAGGSTSRAPCRSNGSVWQPVLPEGSDHILMSGDQAILNPVTVPTKGHLQTFASNTITSSGAGPAYVCDVNTGATVAPPNYASIGLLLLRPHATFQANATCNVNTLGAKKLYKMSSGSPVQIGATDVDSDAAYFLIYMAALDGGAGGLLVVPMEGGGGVATSKVIVEEIGQCRGNAAGIYPNGKIGPGADLPGFDDIDAQPLCWSGGNVSALYLLFPHSPATYRGARLAITLPDNWNSAGTLTFRFRAGSVFGAGAGTSAVFAARLGCQGTGATTVLDTTWGTNSTVTITPGGLAGFGPSWRTITISDKSACTAGQRGEVLIYRIHDDAADDWTGDFQVWVMELTIPLS